VPTGNWGSTDLGGTVGTLNAPVPLRVGWWAPADGEPARGTIILAVGRAEFIEVYAETVRDLLARGYTVVAFDFRGQGGSHRRAARGGHVDRFEDYVEDLAAVVRFANQEALPRPYHIVGHSMGALVALLAAPALEREVERMVLAAPLLEVVGLPAPAGLLSAAARLGTFAGLARRPVDNPVSSPRPFAGNRLTSDRDRFEAVKRLVDENPDLVSGPPTIGWVSAAFRAMQTVRRRAGRPLPIPSLFVASGQDAIVSTAAIVRFARATPGAGLVTVPGARHQILLERDGLRNLFFAALDAYLADAPQRLTQGRQPRFARTLTFTAAASGPPRFPEPEAPPPGRSREDAVPADARDPVVAQPPPRPPVTPAPPPTMPTGLPQADIARETAQATTPATARAPAAASDPPEPPAIPEPSPLPPTAEAPGAVGTIGHTAGNDASAGGETAVGEPAVCGSAATPAALAAAPSAGPLPAAPPAASLAGDVAFDGARGHGPAPGGARAARIRERLRRRARRRPDALRPGEGGDDGSAGDTPSDSAATPPTEGDSAAEDQTPTQTPVPAEPAAASPSQSEGRSPEEPASARDSAAEEPARPSRASALGRFLGRQR